MRAKDLNAQLSRLAENPIARVVAYYILLFAATALFLDLVPQAASLIYGGVQQSTADISTNIQDTLTNGTLPLFQAPPGLPLAEVFAMAAAFALMLPVAWIYIMTRRRKGFRQSVVQTLVILPIVVAGVVFMVKNSLALAFSLGGIVAAVSFRNTARDSKDAVYIFLATGVGFAAGVQSVDIARGVSIIYNAVVLVLWWTDFGRRRPTCRARRRSTGSSARWPWPIAPAPSCRRSTSRSSSPSRPTSSAQAARAGRRRQRPRPVQIAPGARSRPRSARQEARGVPPARAPGEWAGGRRTPAQSSRCSTPPPSGGSSSARCPGRRAPKSCSTGCA